MPRPTFQGVRLIVGNEHERVLRQALPEALRGDFDSGRRRYNGNMPAIMGDPLNLELGLSWGVQYGQGTITVWAIDPNMNLTYEQVREFEDRHHIREHPQIMFAPLAQEGDERTRGIMQRNHVTYQHWDAGLIGPGSPNP
ncbi:MAG TPA: hypothetical protein VJM32_00470 [Candidatus Saccharimonadales bacterium]|nr:hypothetical protein [Candidatus Saccharimonadales bacterium]